MTETFKLVLTKFTDEAITLSTLILLIVIALLMFYWIYNRRKFQKLTHQIPASVVKNYLDSIIQNSTALKSSLFRGGGLDVGTGIPSVFPTSELPGSGPIGISTGGASQEELNQKIAEVQALNRKIADKDLLIKDLEKRLSQSKPGGANPAEIKALQDEITRLKSELNSSKEALTDEGKEEAILRQEIDTVSRERDDFKERLMEYEIIEEDLANLKKLQQENEQLRNTVALLQNGGAAPASQPAVEAVEEETSVDNILDDIASIEEVVAVEEEPVVEEVAEAAPATEDDFEAEMARAIQESAAPAATEEEVKEEPKKPETKLSAGEQKSAEELLSEFEKMLG